jgi:hypothetical protein
MASFVIDLDDSPERWEQLYAAIAALAAPTSQLAAEALAAPAPAYDDSALAWVLSSADWNGS